MSRPRQGNTYNDQFYMDLNFSEADKQNVIAFLEERTGIRHYDDEMGHYEIISDKGTTYELKSDRKAIRTKNMVFEILCRPVNQMRWVYTCGADLFIVTGDSKIRIYDWPALQFHLVTWGDALYEQILMGDRFSMLGYLLRPKDIDGIKRFLVYEGPWKQPDLNDVMDYKTDRLRKQGIGGI